MKTQQEHLSTLAYSFAVLEREIEELREKLYDLKFEKSRLLDDHDDLKRRHTAALKKIDKLYRLILPAVNVDVCL